MKLLHLIKKINKLFISIFLAVSLIFSSFASSISVKADVNPPVVDTVLAVGQSININKTVDTPEIPPLIDVCLLEDETASFGDDIANLQGGTTASDIYDNVVLGSPQAQFAVAGFRDYPVSPYGNAGDHVYRLLSTMSPTKANWLNGVSLLTAGGGNDIPEAQYDAIVAAAGPGTFKDPTRGLQNNCGWRNDPNAKRVLVVTTDAPFHNPDGTHVKSQAATIAALTAQKIIVVGLKAPGTGLELDALAAATGGSVQPLSSNGANIATAILAGLGNLPITITPVAVGCDPLDVSFNPASKTVTSGDPATFVETIAVPNDTTLEGTTHSCTVEFRSGDEVVGIEKIRIRIPDTTPPRVSCIETVNPNGQTVPPAGSTTLPGSKGGQNEDGFYQLLGRDNVDPNVKIYVTDIYGSGPFGVFASGDNVKITEAKGATPTMKKIGSTNGEAGAVLMHITLNGDAVVTATDAAGNKTSVTCLVPPPPK